MYDEEFGNVFSTDIVRNLDHTKKLLKGTWDFTSMIYFIFEDQYKAANLINDNYKKITVSSSEDNKEEGKMENRMDSREIIAIDTYKKVLQVVEELHRHSNATEATFLIDIENFLKDKIDYYESGGT